MRKIWFAIFAAPFLAGCVSTTREIPYNALPAEPGRNVVAGNQKPVQCAPYARAHSQIKIFGDAWTWWDQAAGKYQRAKTPEEGAVMVLLGYAGPERGHVAVVQKIISPREIRVDHANWLDDGSVFLNNPVTDVSADNDWSKVRVWNIQTGAWGGNIYPVKGFILPHPPESERVAMAEPPANTQ
jgi:CHAP domain